MVLPTSPVTNIMKLDFDEHAEQENKKSTEQNLASNNMFNPIVTQFIHCLWTFDWSYSQEAYFIPFIKTSRFGFISERIILLCVR